MTFPEGLIPFVNIILVIWLLVAVLVGYKSGLLWQLLNLLGFLAVFVFAWLLCTPLSQLITLYPKSLSPFAGSALESVMYQTLNQLTWFLALLVVGFLLLLLLKPLAKVVTQLPIVKGVNQVLGAVFSLVPYAICVILLSFIIQSPLFTNGRAVIDSTLFRYVSVLTDTGTSALSSAFAENQAVQKLLYDQKNLTKDDIKTLTKYLVGNKVTKEQVQKFLEDHGIAISDVGNMTSDDYKKLSDWLKSSDATAKKVQQYMQDHGIAIDDIIEALGN